MNTIHYSLDDAKNGGKVTAFTYSHSLSELCGSWSASVIKGSFTAGSNIDFGNVMKNGIISRAKKDSSGLWHLEGYDAGVRLMRSTPDIDDLPKGNAKIVIQSLANHCGISLSMEADGLSGFNVRSLISGSTCAEAILELAMFSGLVAFIGNDGALHVKSPKDSYSPPKKNVIDDSSSDFDLDGYASQVTIVLRRNSLKDDDDINFFYYTGETPSTTPKHVNYSGSFSNGSYSMTMLEPFGVAEKVNTTISENGVTITTEEKHNYSYKHKTVWRENQEYVLFAFIETGYTLTKTTEGNYSTENSGTLSFKEITTETMTRSLSRSDAVGVPDDWDGEIDMVDSETITRSTVREGGKAPTDNMPAYSPPFDSQITRSYSRQLRGRGLVCNETEKRYEARQVGSISPVKVDGKLVPHFLLGSNLAIQTHSTPQWVEIDTQRTYYEQYDREGNCVLSTRSEYCDDGSNWLVAHALTDTGDDDLNEYQQAYAKFSQEAQGLEVSLGESIITSPWQFLELQGRVINKTGESIKDALLSNVDDWFSNGEYLPSETCPHYDSSTWSCNIHNIDVFDKGIAYYDKDIECSRHKGKLFWRKCTRATKMLQFAREREISSLDTPIIGKANSGSGAVHRREIYIDDIISDNTAQSIADNIAANILKVKGSKGLRKTVTIPYDPNLALDGAVVEISHDWENLTSSVTYRAEGSIPDFLTAKTVSSIADFVAVRESSRLCVPKYGVVSGVKNNIVTVKVGSSSVKCSTKLTNLGKGDTVLVSFPAGNKIRGQVISRL